MSLALKLVVVFVSFATLAVSQVANCARNYTVKPGDFCDSISAAQHASTFQLAKVNANKIDATCSNLVIGELLCLGIIGQDCNITAVVKTGDSCAAIAATAKISSTLLMQNNPNINSTCGNIYPGEVLCTANKLFV